MNGYFSRIAKQTGLRVASPGGLASTQAAKTRPREAPPLESVQTRLVAPSDPASQSFSVPERKLDRAQPRGDASNRKSVAEQRPGPVSQAEVFRATENSAHEAASEAVATVSSASNGFLKSAPAIHHLLPTEFTPVARIPVLPSVTLADSGSPTAARKDTGKEPMALASEAPPPTAEIVEEKRYFTKTAAAIERGELRSPELQKVLLLEVQEWVSGARTTPEIPGLNRETDAGEANPRTPWPVSNMAGVNPREMNQAADFEKPTIEEQRFDLSIGTISVVIEEPQKPTPLAELRRPNPAHPESGRESVRPFSRWDRNYL
jgi:hypothetical protein